MVKNQSTTGKLKGEVFLLTANQHSFAESQIELLKAIHECGSISKAAKRVGISYKTAWERIEAMNNMSNQPLVTRSAGGAQGGGTILTELGQRIIDGFQALRDEHQAFIEKLGSKLHSLNDIANFMRSEHMKTSARNQFRGCISLITLGSVNAEIELDIGADQSLVAIISKDSCEHLGLQTGHEVIALIKASSVILSSDTTIITSARNKFTGKIVRIVEGIVNTDISLDIGGGKSVSAMITNTSSAQLGLQVGDTAYALFKAGSVILMNAANG